MSQLEHSARVAEARKVLAERPAEIDRKATRQRIAYQIAEKMPASRHSQMCPVCAARQSVAKCNCWVIVRAERDAEAALEVVWLLIESQQAVIAKRDRALEAVLAYNDELLAIVNEAAGKEGSSSSSSGGGSP
jgi:hypothetical protein